MQGGRTTLSWGGYRRALGLTVGACCLAWAAPAGAALQVLEPTRVDDPAPNGCKPRNCSLREAVLAANARNGPALIKLEDRRYRLQIEPLGGPKFEVETGDLDVLGTTTIRGKGPARTTVNARGLDRIFDLRALGSRYAVRGMTLRRGAAFTQGGGDNPFGGAIQVFASDLAVRNVAIRASDSGELGGGIMAFDATMRLSRVVLLGNEADDYGGGIYAERAGITIERSTVDGNTAGIFGGGLYIPDANQAPNGGTVRASTFSDNTAQLGGGIMLDDENGIFGGSAEPTLAIVNSTIAGNHVPVSGGGISALQNAVVSLDNTTVAYNAADTDSSGGGFGGGLHQSTGAVFQVRDSILAMNTVGSSGGGAACTGDYTDQGGNVVAQWTAPCSIAATTLSAQIGTLAANGGPTETIRLLTGSPAIGAATTCPARDQRGVPRPEDCDSGAFERKAP